MNRLTFALLLASGLLAAKGDELPKAETILDRFVEVTGGKAAYEKIHTQVAKGTMEIAGRGIKGPISVYRAEPNKDYSVADLEGAGKVESGTDGDVVWERSAIAGPRVKSGAEREETLRAAVFEPHVNWRKLYVKAETSGSGSVDGDDCYKVVLTPKTGNPVTEYYSKKSGLLLKTTSIHSTQMGDIASEGFEKDYKQVSGIAVPFTMIEKVAGQEIQVHLDTVEFNVTIPKDRFELPDEIKELVGKKGAANASK